MANSKTKGTNAERELLHKFWEHGWAGTRTAGSGNTSLPAPDLLVSNQEKSFALECKAFKKNHKYFEPEEILQLQHFSRLFGAEPIIAIKFNYQPWYFLKLEHLTKTNKKWALSLDLAKKKGLKFEDFLLQNQKI